MRHIELIGGQVDHDDSDQLLPQDEDNIDEEEISDDVFEDVMVAFEKSRFTAPIFSIICFFIALQLTVFPYQKHSQSFSHEKDFNSMEKLKLVRPVLDETIQMKIQIKATYSETQIWMPNYDVINLRHFQHVSHEGNFKVPELFYGGVTFGLTARNSHDLEYSAQSIAKDADLYEGVTKMYPIPTNVMKRSARYNSSGWGEEGLAVHFSYSDLEKQGKLSSDVLQPWKRVLEDVLILARQFKQVYVTMWYPHSFGRQTDTSPGADPHLYTNIIQQVVPTRTGLNSIKSTVVVWLSAINSTDPKKPQLVYRKPWTKEDHWSQFVRNEAAKSTRKQLHAEEEEIEL